MACIIGKTKNTEGLCEVFDHEIVSQKKFDEILHKTIEDLYPDKTPLQLKIIVGLKEEVQNGLCSRKSVHIGGKYFFTSKRPIHGVKEKK